MTSHPNMNFGVSFRLRLLTTSTNMSFRENELAQLVCGLAIGFCFNAQKRTDKTKNNRERTVVYIQHPDPDTN